MSLLSFIRRILPPSSNSFHAMWKELGEVNGQLLTNTAQAYELQKQIDLVRGESRAQFTELSGLLWCMYRREGESIDDARKRFFVEFPSASGSMRLLQKANAQLLQEFDRLCKLNDISYFLAQGTLLGAARHKGSIPWDDDVDVGVLSGDIKRIQNAVKSDPRYKVSIVYDNNVSCKQIRFMWSDEDLPCFVDLFVYDYVKGDREACLSQYRKLRDSIKAETVRIKNDYGCGAMVSVQDECFAEYEAVFNKAADEAYQEGLMCDADQAQFLMWGLENMEIITDACPIISVERFGDLTQVEYEGYLYPAPENYEAYLQDMYGDWRAMPKRVDINITHVNASRLIPQQREALEAVIECEDKLW